MLELDMPLQSPSSFSQGGGLYRCRTFPGLKDLLQENNKQDEDEDDEEGYWSSLQDTDTSQTHEGSMPSPGLLMSSSSSWESWKGSNDLWLEEGERDSQASSPGILLSSEDLWRNSREAEEKNKCWMEGISKLSKTSTFNSLNNGARSFRREVEDHSDSDSDDEAEEDISLHCYILPSASRSSFYFVKRSLEVIPEEDESQDTIEEDQLEENVENSELEEENPSSEVNNNNSYSCTEVEQSKGKDNTSGTVIVKCDEKYNNLSLLEELSHQDINDMYCVLSYMPQNNSECRLLEHTFRVGSPPVCDSGSPDGTYGKNSTFISANNIATKRRQSNPLGSPIPSGPSSFRPRCAKVYPADNDDTTCMNAWVYQDELKQEISEDAITPCELEDDITVSDSKNSVTRKLNSSKHKSNMKSTKRKHKKHTRVYSFLHRIWKSFRRKMLIMETV